MIKFRYKRKEPANNGGSPNASSVKSTNNKSVEIKSNDNKDDTKHSTLKCEKTTELKAASQVIKAKTGSQQEYMEDCIRAIVVSV